MVRRSCVSCGAPLRQNENECRHCGATYEPKKKIERLSGFLYTRITSAIFVAVGSVRFLNYGEETKSELIFWVALAALPLIIEKETIRRIYDHIDKQRAVRFDEMKKQKQSTKMA
jgi:predicted nucleic acid-binding Zn ribbon protein